VLARVLPKALKSRTITLRANALVARLHVDPATGLVSSIECVDRVTHRSFEVRTRSVILCASTIETLRIMLNSRSSVHQAGLGNSTGLLGRGLMDHFAYTVAGPVPSAYRHLPALPLGGAHSVCVPRFRNLESASAMSFIRGYGIWGGLHRALPGDQREGRWFLAALHEVLSRDENRVTIDPSVTDAWGVPAARVRLTYSHNEWRMRVDSRLCLGEIADAAGLEIDREAVSGPGEYVHELGGARMGRSSRSSVISASQQCWDCPNVFIGDGSCFPSSGWQNPTLTMMALGLRSASCLIAALRAGPLTSGAR
jgi:choline dehydrogenase-like flavoprotein